ncbi:MAG TPA: hypothetical protein VF824_03295 [Thermoanaerobaculia bacterium]|jgi:hypothetical protein
MRDGKRRCSPTRARYGASSAAGVAFTDRLAARASVPRTLRTVRCRAARCCTTLKLSRDATQQAPPPPDSRALRRVGRGIASAAGARCCITLNLSGDPRQQALQPDWRATARPSPIRQRRRRGLHRVRAQCVRRAFGERFASIDAAPRDAAPR